MQKVLGYMRKAIQEFDLIQNGDKIAVGVSGGKDSLVLLKGLVIVITSYSIHYTKLYDGGDRKAPTNTCFNL